MHIIDMHEDCMYIVVYIDLVIGTTGSDGDSNITGKTECYGYKHAYPVNLLLQNTNPATVQQYK